ncbi:hypothetical protein [Candidatus Cryosericum septentrionale]|jgi:uncharacterized OB-fold protein|uniref:Uncharacterized protein n=1 Tax=Candidatus Cryosericum septentrionale TaxID=2290913 RepID=A0A398DYU9_9BACT|nr:hypothetical protein [Candidatus Cryosericum septentrionale]RIE17077.1 hypothetical protein SMC1_03750 [Candidatus Cryosericum septentrionale]
MKYLKSILVLVVLLALLGANQSVLVRADKVSAATNTEQVPVMANGKIHPFSVSIGTFGYKDTSETYTVKAGKYIIAYLEKSGGHDVYMTVICPDDQHLVGGNNYKVKFAKEGQTKLLWTNITATTKYVTIRMSSPALAPVHATGTVSTGWYTKNDTTIY